MPNKKTGVRRLVNAMGYSVAGLQAAWKHEAAFRQEIVALAFLLPLALWLGENAVERSLMIFSGLLVLVVELVNSAVEATVDRFGPEQHQLSKRAKDLGSAAVFISLVIAAVVWLLLIF